MWKFIREKHTQFRYNYKLLQDINEQKLFQGTRFHDILSAYSTFVVNNRTTVNHYTYQ